MIEELRAEPTLSGRLLPDAPPPLLAPLVSPPLPWRSALGVDLILEGFLAHHGVPRALQPRGEDRHVLAGDFCYATGLVRVAEAGDMFVIRALAELVALSSGLVADGRGDLLPVVWRAVTAAVAAPDRTLVAPALTDAVAALVGDGDAGPLGVLAAGLPETPDLDEVLRRDP